MPDQRNSLCPDCGVPLYPLSGSTPDTTSPLAQPTPFLRLVALAGQTGIHVFDMSPEDAAGLAGAIAVGIDKEGELRATIGIAEDLDEDLRADVLAFGIAVFIGDTKKLTSRLNGVLGIGRDRLQAASEGAGHLAWHLLVSSGRNSPSATFGLVPI
jgi:hypothetical protein